MGSIFSYSGNHRSTGLTQYSGINHDVCCWNVEIIMRLRRELELASFRTISFQFIG